MPNSKLRFRLQTQAQYQWCWAAVAASTARFYDRQTAQTQCKIVNAIVSPSKCCCADGNTAECDVQESLEKALAYVGHLRACQRGALSWHAVDEEMESSNPVGVQISLISGTAHFVTIIGTGTRHNGEIIIADPENGRTTAKHKTFARSPHGVWRETYLCQP